jgi:Glutamine amidotransferases class-II
VYTHQITNNRVAVIATAPLTCGEVWREMGRGDLIAFCHGTACSSEAELAAYIDESERSTPLTSSSEISDP